MTSLQIDAIPRNHPDQTGPCRRASMATWTNGAAPAGNRLDI